SKARETRERISGERLGGQKSRILHLPDYLGGLFSKLGQRLRRAQRRRARRRILETIQGGRLQLLFRSWSRVLPSHQTHRNPGWARPEFCRRRLPLFSDLGLFQSLHVCEVQHQGVEVS